MSRAVCTVCLRPEKTCICHLFVEIDNNVDVIVLQHPTEVNQSKGTITLLANSLKNCRVLIGENFNHNKELIDLLSNYEDRIYLLYPSENAEVLHIPSPPNKEHQEGIITADSSRLNVTKEFLTHKNKCIVLIDGTWKKAYKMYMLNTILHNHQHITLPDSTQGDYKIRKTQKANALSSLEACTYALMAFESDVNKYQQLLSSFKQFNDFQLAYRK